MAQSEIQTMHIEKIKIVEIAKIAKTAKIDCDHFLLHQ